MNGAARPVVRELRRAPEGPRAEDGGLQVGAARGQEEADGREDCSGEGEVVEPWGRAMVRGLGGRRLRLWWL